jgi:hypothetical protein
MIDAQNRFLGPLFERGQQPLTLAIGYSEFREYAFILSTDKKSWLKKSKSLTDNARELEAIPKGWGVVASLASFEVERMINWIREINRLEHSDEIMDAVRYLTEVLLEEIRRVTLLHQEG